MTRGLNIIWFLNVDVVDKLEFNWEDTVKNFGSQLNKMVKFVVLPKKNPGFLESCHVLSREMHDYVINNKILDQ